MYYNEKERPLRVSHSTERVQSYSFFPIPPNISQLFYDKALNISNFFCFNEIFPIGFLSILISDEVSLGF